MRDRKRVSFVVISALVLGTFPRGTFTRSEVEPAAALASAVSIPDTGAGEIATPTSAADATVQVHQDLVFARAAQPTWSPGPVQRAKAVTAPRKPERFLARAKRLIFGWGHHKPEPFPRIPPDVPAR